MSTVARHIEWWDSHPEIQEMVLIAESRREMAILMERVNEAISEGYMPTEEEFAS